jgi:hypothetical protein
MTWTMAGRDPATLGLVATASGEMARVLLAPDHVPAPLVAAVVDESRRAPARLDVRTNDAVRLCGRPLVELHEVDDGGHERRDGRDEGHGDRAAHGHYYEGHGDRAHHDHQNVGHGVQEGHDHHDAGHGVQEGHDHHDAGHGVQEGHDHRDMMAIVGDPSADGLVMEAIDFRFGPLSAALPGGLLVHASLDGDVVAACEVQATLRAGVDGPADVPDLLAPVSWAVAEQVAREVADGSTVPARDQWERLAAVELERALSHVAWLRSLGRVLGWTQLANAAHRAVTEVSPLHAHRAGQNTLTGVRAVRASIARTARIVAGRRFAARTRGRAEVSDEALVGPNARAAGRGADSRAQAAFYDELGFIPVEERDGDACARARVRMREVEQSLDLAAAALERVATAAGQVSLGAFATSAGARVEGPRGPLLVSRLAREGGSVHAVPGAAATLAVAGAGVVGLEWSAALASLASFDLSPWSADG